VNRSRLAFALALLAPTLVLGGCSDDPVPKIAPPRDSPAVSGEPSPSDSAKDPVATVKAWVDARNGALAAGDTSEVEDLSAADCRTCRGLIDPIKKIYADGGHFETTGWRIVKAKQREHQQVMTVDAGVSIAGGVTVPEEGGAPNRYPPEHHIVVFKVKRQADQLVIGFVGFLS